VNRATRRQGPAGASTRPGSATRQGAVLAVVLGLVLLVVAAVTAGVATSGQVTSAGEERSAYLAAAPPADRLPTGRAPGPQGAPPPYPTRDARPAAAADARSIPVTVAIGALDITAEVDQVGVDPATGRMEVPEQADRLGWYRYGPGLDSHAGSMVIAGHVDTVAGPGALYHLGQLEPGDTVTVTGADGQARSFQVVAREVHHKSEIPLSRYFARDGSPRLTLITCGGPFDRDTRQYRDNIVITAVPT
jgi:hypothetical protein